MARCPLVELSAALAEDAWNTYAADDLRPLPRRPLVVVLVGVPLSGKTTLARALAARARTRTLHIENDALRPRIAQTLGAAGPVFDARENFLTYQTAWNLLGIGLEAGVNVIHDATSLTESGRRGAYARAEERFVPVVVVFVQTPPDVLEARAAVAAPTRQEAYAKLGRKAPDPAACTRPYVVLDGARAVEENLERLANDLHFVPLFAADQV